MIRHLPAEIRRKRPDVLFCAGSTYTIVAVAMKILLGRACPPIVVKISNDLSRPDLPRAMRAAWSFWLRAQRRFVDRWVVIDAAIVTELRGILGPVDLAVVPDPAIDALPVLPETSKPATDEAPRRYVAVGRLVSQKDFVTMIRAFALARRLGDHLTIIGDGPERNRLERWARALRIEHAVTFVGHLPNAAARIVDFDTLLLSSRYEGVPAVMIEGLVSGLRIVSTDCGVGVRSLLDDGALGRIADRGDVAAFSAAMLAAFDAPRTDVVARMQAYTLDASAALYVEALADTAAKAREARSARAGETIILGANA